MEEWLHQCAVQRMKQKKLVWGFHCGGDLDCGLPGFDAVYCVRRTRKFQKNMLSPCSRYPIDGYTDIKNVQSVNLAFIFRAKWIPKRSRLTNIYVLFREKRNFFHFHVATFELWRLKWRTGFRFAHRPWQLCICVMMIVVCYKERLQQILWLQEAEAVTPCAVVRNS